MLIKHHSRQLKHRGKILKHHSRYSGGSIKHLVRANNGGNVAALKTALQHMTLKPKTRSRIKF